ncbi:MAG TPA: ester cyclase [Acidimicrobiia bacterium]|nr:ester cyclase [Acidimicrobiia bacterium]
MSTEDNKAIVRRAYLDGLNHRDLGVVDEVFDVDYVVHYPHTGPVKGVEKAKEFLTQFLTAFPDCVFTIEDQVAEDDKVVTRWSCRGTHLGEWHGLPGSADPTVPPSGRPVAFGATDIYLIRDGKIVEEWNTLEQLDVLSQIGALPGT